ncbi:hypothetical protein CU048_05895 [Beijerinckiaceae bacterium]|nr:hypothetical protein CU048_05895 [Beijerinckiaceae bacterium]
MSDFNITLYVDQDSIDYLNQNKYYLYGIKFLATQFPASPLIWFTDEVLLKSTRLQWNKTYQAFISTQLDYRSGTVIIAYSSKAKADVIPSASSEDIKLGQEMIVGDNGALSIQNGQVAQIVIVSKTTNTRYSFGLNQSLDSSPPTPLFIAQILSGESKIMMPITEKVLLTFSQIDPPLQTSTVVDKAFAPGILISLSSAETSREVTYDINGDGWGPINQEWITEITAGDDLTGIYNG